MKFLIMDNTGHSTVKFSKTQRAKADALFNKLLAEGRTAATRADARSDYALVRDPADLREETLFIPRRQGG